MCGVGEDCDSDARLRECPSVIGASKLSRIGGEVRPTSGGQLNASTSHGDPSLGTNNLSPNAILQCDELCQLEYSGKRYLK